VSARGAAACWLVAGVTYPTLEAIAARALPGYRYSHDYISDLGRPGSPLSHLMNTAFVVQGVLFFVAATLLVRARPTRHTLPFLAAAAANAVGNVVVANVPSGSAGTAWVHVTAAVLAIVGGNVAIAAGTPLIRAAGAPKTYSVVSLTLAAGGLSSFMLLAVASTTSLNIPGAVCERTSVYTIIGWQLLSAVELLARPRRSRPPRCRIPTVENPRGLR
jgi:hypothetical membrane protein